MAADGGFERPFGLADAASAAEAIGRGEVKCAELVDAVLGGLDAVNANLNAVVVTCPDRARDEARLVDRARVSGTALGALAGVPISVKEAFHTAGLPTTWGLPEHAGWAAAEDAVVVQRLRAAGAIVVGKTNVAAMLADYRGRPRYVRNRPWVDLGCRMRPASLGVLRPAVS